MEIINEAYHQPKSIGVFDLSTTSSGKSFLFEFDADVIAQAKIVAVHAGKVVKTYTSGDGLTISEDSRSVTLIVNGDDFDLFAGHRLLFQCAFFVAGDAEVVFYIDIIKTYL